MDWWITRDLIDDGRKEHPDPPEGGAAFRIYDDDGELYYCGQCRLDAPGVTGFEPLDWAQNNAGATEIRYRDERGHWGTL